jgi:hypothetical protein
MCFDESVRIVLEERKNLAEERTLKGVVGFGMNFEVVSFGFRGRW